MKQICAEFGVSPNMDWRSTGPNHGLGRLYNYNRDDLRKDLKEVVRLAMNNTKGNSGIDAIRRVNEDVQKEHPTTDASTPRSAGAILVTEPYDGARMSFTEETKGRVQHVGYIVQDTPVADTAWSTLILDNSQGFTRPGVERLNDSIRTYVWCLLGAQAQAKTGILGAGRAFEAQKQFLALVEDAISSPVDLAAAIKRYQDVLQNASSEVNYVIGTGLYMCPNDMLLRIGQVQGYNNMIVIAEPSARLKRGVNSGINVSDTPPPPPPVQGPMNAHHEPEPSPITVPPPTVNASEKASADQHQNEKNLSSRRHSSHRPIIFLVAKSLASWCRFFRELSKEAP
jgi:hypothetical protein